MLSVSCNKWFNIERVTGAEMCYLCCVASGPTMAKQQVLICVIPFVSHVV